MAIATTALRTSIARLDTGTSLGDRMRLHLLGVLHERQPELAAAAWLSLLAIVPCLFAMLVDPRTVNDINVWIKPSKFFVSFAIYYATLAWAFGYLPQSAQGSVAGRLVIRGALVVGVYEMSWIVLAAANGVLSHFNDSTVGAIAYGLAGIGSLVLIGVILMQGMMIARQRTVPIAPALRWGIVSGAVIAFGATLITAGTLSMNGGHWVGGIPSDAYGLPLLGWSRIGGDLRVAHFFALHAQQALPALGLAAVTLGRSNARGTMLLGALAYAALVVVTFVQALRGVPFIGL